MDARENLVSCGNEVIGTSVEYNFVPKQAQITNGLGCFNPLVTSRTNLYDFGPDSHFELLISDLVTQAGAECIMGKLNAWHSF